MSKKSTAVCKEDTKTHVHCETHFEQLSYCFVENERPQSRDDKHLFLTRPEQKHGFEYIWLNKPSKSCFTNYFEDWDADHCYSNCPECVLS